MGFSALLKAVLVVALISMLLLTWLTGGEGSAPINVAEESVPSAGADELISTRKRKDRVTNQVQSEENSVMSAGAKLSISFPAATASSEPLLLSSPPSLPSHLPRHAKFLYTPDAAAPQGYRLKGNGRCIIPLLLTDAHYHGTKLLATTVKGWLQKLLSQQGTMDLVLYYDVAVPNLVADIVAMLSLKPAAAGGEGGPSFESMIHPDTLAVLPASDEQLLKPNRGYFLSPHHETLAIRLLPTRVPLPLYIRNEPELLNRSDWRRCGCPPYCPAKQASIGYIQGTRWYTYDLFHEPLMARYSYFMKMDVDIWMFRSLNTSLVDEMKTRHALVGHTGLIFNGGGCSNDLHRAILEYFNCPFSSIQKEDQGRRSSICTDGRIVSANSSWWKQDDGVYYTNFVVYSSHFFLDKEVMALHAYLNEYRDGFFRWRWTDQSLAHKVLGVFAGPDEDSFRIDWSYLRWKRGHYRPLASFWHGKSGKTRKDLGKYTRL